MGKILVEQWIRVATSDRVSQQLQNITDVDQTLNIRSKYKSLKWIVKKIVNAHVKFALLCHIDMPELMMCTPLRSMLNTVSLNIYNDPGTVIATAANDLETFHSVFRTCDPPRKVYDSVIHMLRLGRHWTEAGLNLTCEVRLAGGGPPLNRTPASPGYIVTWERCNLYSRKLSGKNQELMIWLPRVGPASGERSERSERSGASGPGRSQNFGEELS